MLNRFIMAEIKSLEAQFKSRDGISHKGVKGSSNEELLKKILEKIIPTNYKIAKNSIIQDLDGKQSPEVDLVIYKTDYLPPFFLEGESAFIPAESVRYVIEVKTTLTAIELETTVAKFEKVRKMKNILATTVLFSFRSDLKEKEELKRYLDQNADYTYNSPLGIICVLNKEYAYLFHERKKISDSLNKSKFFESLTKKKWNGYDSLKIGKYEYDQIFYWKHQWIGQYQAEDSNCLLLLLVGIANTLVEKSVGYYLLDEASIEKSFKVFSIQCEDMWGNKSLRLINYNGVEAERKYTYNLETGINGEAKLLIK